MKIKTEFYLWSCTFYLKHTKRVLIEGKKKQKIKKVDILSFKNNTN
jgi:hypothetical protein